MFAYFLYFVVGGIVTTLIVALEQSGMRLLSGLAALFPVFTLTAYLFIGQTRGGAEVAQHSWLVLFGTLAAWVPYMIAVALLAPRFGTAKAIPAGLAVFIVCATAYLLAVQRNGWFR
ncbi:MAG TPA: GlpM family protein [Patescibacteria group bacterium]|nr:GlpM family protein [Patescibacteria group bacterium]